METELISKIIRLESIAEIENFKYGNNNIVQIKYKFAPYDKKRFSELIGMYYFSHSLGMRYHKFIVPMTSNEKAYIMMFKARKENVSVEDGKILLLETRCKIHQYKFGEDSEYNYYNELLKQAGLR